MNYNTVAMIIATLSIAVAGYFAQDVNAVSNKVDTVTSNVSADHQQINDIDARTTRIEDKLDTIISKNTK